MGVPGTRRCHSIPSAPHGSDARAQLSSASASRSTPAPPALRSGFSSQSPRGLSAGQAIVSGNRTPVPTTQRLRFRQLRTARTAAGAQPVIGRPLRHSSSSRSGAFSRPPDQTSGTSAGTARSSPGRSAKLCSLPRNRPPLNSSSCNRSRSPKKSQHKGCNPAATADSASDLTLAPASTTCSVTVIPRFHSGSDETADPQGRSVEHPDKKRNPAHWVGDRLFSRTLLPLRESACVPVFFHCFGDLVHSRKALKKDRERCRCTSEKLLSAKVMKSLISTC